MYQLERHGHHVARQAPILGAARSTAEASPSQLRGRRRGAVPLMGDSSTDSVIANVYLGVAGNGLARLTWQEAYECWSIARIASRTRFLQPVALHAVHIGTGRATASTAE